MINQMHGLCSSCAAKCTQSLHISKKQNQCSRCKQNIPDVIVEEDGQTLAICLKCYLRSYNTPKKSEIKQQLKASTSFYRPLPKEEYSNKGFLSSQGKTIRKIEKFFAKFEGKMDQMLKQLGKKTIVTPPLTWGTVFTKCDRISPLMFLFVSKNQIVGAFHTQSIRMGQKPYCEDSESGFFVSQRNKIQLQFYKASKDLVAYSNKHKMISFGNPSCLQIHLESSDPKVKCDVLMPHTEWLYHFVYKI